MRQACARCRCRCRGVNASWSQPGGLPSNNPGHLALSDSVNKVWAADAGTGSSSRGRLSAVPLVADGKVYTLDAGGSVTAFAASSGATLWSANVTPKNEKNSGRLRRRARARRRPPLRHHGLRRRRCARSGNGAVAWTKQIGKPVRSSPTASSGKVYFVSADNVLHALSGSSGDELWRARGLPQPATILNNVSPAVSGGIVVAPFPAGDVTAFAAGSGERAWSESLARSSESTGVRRPRRSRAAGDRPGRGVRGEPRRQDDRVVGVDRRAAVDAQHCQHTNAVGRG